MPTSITTILSSAPKDQHGMAAGVLSTMRQVGAVLGIAVVGAVINYNELLKTHGAKLLRTEYASIYTHAFSHGLIASGVFSVIAFIFAVVCLPKRLSLIKSN